MSASAGASRASRRPIFSRDCLRGGRKPSNRAARNRHAQRRIARSCALGRVMLAGQAFRADDDHFAGLDVAAGRRRRSGRKRRFRKRRRRTDASADCSSFAHGERAKTVRVAGDNDAVAGRGKPARMRLPAAAERLEARRQECVRANGRPGAARLRCRWWPGRWNRDFQVRGEAPPHS